MKRLAVRDPALGPGFAIFRFGRRVQHAPQRLKEQIVSHQVAQRLQHAGALVIDISRIEAVDAVGS